jgi:predicted RNA-binding protein with PUA-like domain
MPERQYWLMKTEPNTFSIEDLKRAPNQTTGWEGVRNYQARNFLRDQVKVGDGVLFYHSRVEPIGVVGIAEVVREAYPDPTAVDPAHRYYDPKSTPENPTWCQVDIRLVKILPRPVTLQQLKTTPGLEQMKVVQTGMRLSVQPVTPEEWATVLRLSGEVP